MPLRPAVARRPAALGNVLTGGLLALGIITAATLVRLVLDPFVGNQVPYVVYVAAAVVVSWVCGVPAAMASVVVSAFLANYLFVPPRYEFIPHYDDSVAMAVYALVAGGLVVLVSQWRQAEEALRSRAIELEAMESRLRSQAEALERADRVKDDFLATLGHELRTPLNAIVGWSSMLLKGSLGDDATRRAYQAIARNAEAQRLLIEDVLDVSRIVNGRLRLEMQQTDLAVPLWAAIDSVKPVAEGRRIEITTHIPAEPASVWADAARMQQVFMNLLTNAVKFTNPGGHIEVNARRAGAHVEVEVADDGAGIAAEMLPHVFDRFSQSDTPATRRHGGLGLGLTIVRHLVELHAGSVSAHSAGEGRGASFVVRLPLDAGERRQVAGGSPYDAAANHLAAEGARPIEGVRVLVVDDEPDGRDVTASVLRQAGANVEAAASGEEALRRIEAARPDVLVFDIGMPEMDGHTLLRTVRARENGLCRIPAVAFTAFAREEDRRRAVDSGFELYLAKPAQPGELIRAVAMLAGRVT